MQHTSITAIRERAEKYLEGGGEKKPVPSFAFTDAKEIIHELNVYHTELELQNEEHRRQQELLHNVKDKYASLYDFAPNGYFVLDDNVRIIEANLTGARALEVDRSGIVGLPFTKFIERNSQDQFYLLSRRAYAATEIQSGELRLVTATGSVFDAQLQCLVYDSSGDGKHYLRCSVVDISKLKQTELELRLSEEKFRSFIEEAFEGFAMLDECGTIIEWNRANEQITGLRRTDVMGHPSWEVQLQMLSPEERSADVAEHLRRTTQQALRTGQSSLFNRTIETPFYRPDGSKGYLLQTVFPITLQTGIRIGTVFRDITERKQNEELLHHSQRMESLGLLAGGIAHDFNNLLQAVLGQTTLVLKSMEEGHPLRGNVAKAAQAAERAAQLTRQLLAYSGRSKFEIRIINLNTFLTENLHLLQVSIGKQIRMETRFDEFLPAIEADPGQLQQVIMNLIINGSEAIGDGHGVISLSTSTQILQEGDTHWWKRTGEPLSPGIYVILEVRDTGCGMGPETLERIFDPFFTTKFTGRGLGLAALLGIVRGHRGALVVESTPGNGTTFRIAIPASFQQPDVASGIELPAPEIALTGTVLLIDDEEFVREAAKDILELHGLTTFSASDGALGVELYRANSSAIDLVLLDLSMPGMSGEETFRRLKEIRPDVRVVLSSGYTESDAMAKLTGQRLAGFIQKPYRSEDLMATMRRFLRPMHTL